MSYSRMVPSSVPARFVPDRYGPHKTTTTRQISGRLRLPLPLPRCNSNLEDSHETSKTFMVVGKSWSALCSDVVTLSGDSACAASADHYHQKRVLRNRIGKAAWSFLGDSFDTRRRQSNCLCARWELPRSLSIWKRRKTLYLHQSRPLPNS